MKGSLILYIAITAAALILAYAADACRRGAAGTSCAQESRRAGTGAQRQSGAMRSTGRILSTQQAGSALFERPGIRRGRAASFVFLAALFLVLFVPEALRQETGNDYMRYVEFFHLAYVHAYVPTEPGFNWLCRLIYGLCGYENYLLLFALFAAGTILFFLAAMRQQAEDFPLTFLLFMFSGYYFQSYNTVRYYLALAIVLYAQHFLFDGRWPAAALFFVLAALFHKSALVVFLFYPLCMLRWKKRDLPLLLCAGAGVLILREPVMDLIVKLYPSYAGTSILAEGGQVSPGNIARNALILVLALWAVRAWKPLTDKAHTEATDRRDTRKSLTDKIHTEAADGWDIRKPLTDRAHTEGTDGLAALQRDPSLRFRLHCTVLALLLYICGWFIPELSRIGYYLMVPQIFLIPQLLRIREEEGAAEEILPEKGSADGTEERQERKKKCGGKRIRDGGRSCSTRLVRAGIILAALLNFAVFLHSAGASNIRILPYRSFLFHELSQTPSRSVGE
ncbi:MAG: EpsG family protein [Lachnospiraceae bacterium]|nr:EpsG family protein [Lachnospiraceae bacterium]